jgi:outer membrane receptor protein involved in Fe transport
MLLSQPTPDHQDTSRHRGNSRIIGIAAAIAIAVALGAAAGASDSRAAAPLANTAADEGAASGGALEEIVVTATRREESISKVPISITAMNQDDLDQKGIRDFSEMVRFTPGVSIDTSGTNAISIRGISSSGGAGTTGIYIDDTPIQMRALGFNPDDTLPKTFDIDRVEVLRGPQGTLFGSGSEGGTVRYIMTQPSVTKESSYARTEVAYTEYGSPSYEGGVAHGGPIIDDVLGFRASIWYRHDGGWINNVNDTTGAITQDNANYTGTVAARLAMLYKPTGGVSITPSVMFQNKQQNNISTYWPAYSNPGAGEFNDATPERIAIPDLYLLPSLKIQVDFANLTLISNSSYYYRNETDSYEGTVYDLAYYQSLGWPNALYAGAPALGCGSASTTATEPCSWYPLLNASGIHLPPGFQNYETPNTMTNRQRTWTQEFRLQSTDDQSRLKWTVGVFWTLAQELSVEQLNDKNIDAFFSALYGPANTPDSIFGPYYSCNGQGTPQPAQYPVPNCDIYINSNKSYDRQIAGFGEATFKITDQFAVTAGGRYGKLGFSLNHYSNGYENYGPSGAGGAEQEDSFTPKLGVTFQADEKNLFYATYAKGFRPGGYNPPLIPSCGPGLIAEGFASGQAPLTYNSDTTQSYEIGSKNNFADRLKIATSVYYIKWDGIQQNVYVGGNCGLQFTDNLGTAVAKGFDLQADADLGAGFTIEASAGYTSARFSKNSLGGLAESGDAISGEAAINYSPGTNPPWSIAIGPQYSFKLMEHDAFVRADWEYSSRNPWLAPVQDPNSSQYDPNAFTLPATSFTSLRAGIKLAGWQVSAFCDNLFDSHTLLNYAQVQIDPFNPSYIANPNAPTSVQQNDFTYRPRTIGITATFKN